MLKLHYFQKLVTLCFSQLFFFSPRVPFYLQQNNIFKAREEKYHSRIRVLEALASGTEEESEVYILNSFGYHFTSVLLQSTYRYKIQNFLFIIGTFL